MLTFLYIKVITFNLLIISYFRFFATLKYLIISEMLMFLSEGKLQRFTETAFEDTKYLENISKIIKEKVPDAEIYTNVFSRIEEEIEKSYYKITYNMIRNKIYYDSKILGKYNLILDGTRFQKAHYEISPEWLYETKERKNNMVFVDVRIKVNS